MINSKRNTLAGLPAESGDSYVDINLIPQIAVERIEILKEGATSLYGSDAIAGVVNFLTYKNFNGGKLKFANQKTQHYGQNERKLEFLYGNSLNDINLVLGGSSSIVGDTAAAQDTHVTMITQLVEGRKDCVAFASPYRSATVGVTTSAQQAKNVEVAADLIPSSSYLVLDSGYMYMYDKYNDVYRFVPLNGSIAGLCANTDQVADAWFSPAGYTRGNIRGAIKLSFNPDQADRDVLYQSRVNPVVNFPGQGVVLFGDRTAQTKPSAFDRINVRSCLLYTSPSPRDS